MRSLDALAAALAMTQNPHLSRLARRAALPKGMTFLLEVAAGEEGALAEARACLQRSEASLRHAARFFVEQVLLDRRNDPYRMLGSTHDAPPEQLRRHMALLIQSLHPDKLQGSNYSRSFSASASARLVTRSWEILKTSERRAAYDASHRHGHRAARTSHSARGLKSSPQQLGRDGLLAKIFAQFRRFDGQKP
jgi:hypothetical protein